MVLDSLIDASALLGSTIGMSVGRGGIADGGEILKRVLGVGFDGFLSLSPVGGANFTVLVLPHIFELGSNSSRRKTTYRELEGLDKTKSLVNRTADWEIVHGNLTKRSSVSCTAASQSSAHRRVPLGSIKNRPRRAMPSSSISTP